MSIWYLAGNILISFKQYLKYIHRKNLILNGFALFKYIQTQIKKILVTVVYYNTQSCQQNFKTDSSERFC